MRVGYCRTSTDDQQDSLQRDALAAAGCERIFADTMSGATTDRPGLNELLAFVREGDTLVVWRLDRLGRSLRHLMDVVETLRARGIQFQSLTESLDTSTAAGELVFHVFAALTQFERRLIQERIRAGLLAARARGVKGGRPRVLTPEQESAALQLLGAGKISHRKIAKAFNCAPTTILRLKARTEVISA